LHGGHILIISEKGVGSTVTVCLPTHRLLPAEEMPLEIEES
jgi:signal transduction histidine kinase